MSITEMDPKARTPVRNRLEAKVVVLEGWVRDGGAPVGAFVPDGPVALRRWTSDDPLLEAWGSPNVVSDPANRLLRERFDNALKQLSSARPEGSSSTVAPENRQIIALAEQNDDLMDKVRRLEGALEQAQHKLALAEAAIAERDAKLHKLLRFGAVD